MAKKYLNKNVYDVAKERIEYIFNEFDNILIAFSGGKDSGVCLNLFYDYAKENNMLDKLAMYHLDYEAQYQYTTDYVEDTFKSFNDIKRFWLCLPIKAQCACNMRGKFWTTWEQDKKELWVRNMPEYDFVINQFNCEFDYDKTDYEVQDNFSKYFSKKYGKTAVIIGIRAGESLNRYRAIKSEKKINNYKNKNYIVSKDKITHNVYPIYDWKTSDIWVYNSKYEKKYNKLYDLFYQAGLPIDKMRVASPFNDCAGATLKYYKVIDQHNWGKMIGRVNGVNFLGLYGDTSAMGWKSIKKPSHFTWQEYCYFLLNTLDNKTRYHYLEKLNIAIKCWREKCTNFKEIPTYKRMCICIIKNDYCCKSLGFSQTKEEIDKRKNAIKKYRELL